MPWSLERKYSGEGRLIITAERVRGSQECCVMETHREDGRLTMRLVAEEDDDDYCEECCYPMGFEFDEVQLAKEGSNEVERCRDLRVCATYDGAGPGAWLQLHRSICTLSLISTWAGPLPHL
ncbi:hypothetical protein VNO78_01420 [Psophocarpus tetragonolobus]|uniref:FAF domain-containing protein n=1 Tax=Psophocarpus tetragonolobus TaxID=3891 RepID=A0AAN9T1R2_PSOTE